MTAIKPEGDIQPVTAHVVFSPYEKSAVAKFVNESGKITAVIPVSQVYGNTDLWKENMGDDSTREGESSGAGRAFSAPDAVNSVRTSPASNTPQNALDALEAVDYVNRWKRDCKEVYDYAIEKGNYGEAEKIHANLRVYETILTALSAEPLTPPPANASQNALDALDVEEARQYVGQVISALESTTPEQIEKNRTGQRVKNRAAAKVESKLRIFETLEILCEEALKQSSAEVVTPLPKEWHGLYQSYKTDTKTYLDALKAIRGVLQTCDDSSDACDEIEEIVKGVFE